MTRGSPMHIVMGGGGDLQPPLGHRWDEAEAHGVKFLRCCCGTEWADHRRDPRVCTVPPEDKPLPALRASPMTNPEGFPQRRQRESGILEDVRRGMVRKVIAVKHGVSPQRVSQIAVKHGLRIGRRPVKECEDE